MATSALIWHLAFQLNHLHLQLITSLRHDDDDVQDTLKLNK